MARVIDNRFTMYEFTREELVEAVRFSPLQRMYIQHIIGEKSHEKISLKFNPAAVIEFAQEEAYLTGEIEILEYLLSQEALVNASPSQE